jgi:hypothetical protein
MQIRAMQIRMSGKFCAISAVLFLTATFAVAADSGNVCPDSADYQQPQHFNGYLVQIVPGVRPRGKDEDNTKSNNSNKARFEFRCLATITPAKGVRKVVGKDWTMAIDAVSGSDVNGAGKPDVVFDGHTSGARCCYEYWIASLSNPPRLIRQLRSQLPGEFQKNSQGMVEIRIPDAAFQFFMLPADQAAMPQVFFRLEGNKLLDVSSEHQAEYDEQISQARSELSPDELAKFRQSRYNDKLFMDQFPAVKGVLTIVLDYLYSGREEQAWQALQEMWPESDQERVKSTILERRARGIVNQLQATEPKAGIKAGM